MRKTKGDAASFTKGEERKVLIDRIRCDMEVNRTMKADLAGFFPFSFTEQISK